jgi:Flp pilus assembly protein TadG
MTLARKLLRQTGGASAVEFALTAPLFMGLIWVTIEAGMALWTQFGIENAVEAAARCASVTTKVCTSASTIATYASHNTLGITIPASAFTFTKAACGNQVAGSYSYGYFTNVFHAAHVTLAAQACFPDINAGG